MDPTSERLSRTIWVGVGLVIVLLCVTFVLSRVQPRAGRASTLPVLGQVADFTLTNQLGRQVTLADLRGKVWVADIIFTKCAGPCPRMTKQMAMLQGALPKTSNARLVTLTTDPDFDTPEVLARYPGRLGVQAAERWLFLTGEKKQIASLGIESLKLSAVEIKPEARSNEADLFIHSTYFILVDKQARLRGIYETGGEDLDWKKIQPAILSNIQQLERE